MRINQWAKKWDAVSGRDEALTLLCKMCKHMGEDWSFRIYWNQHGNWEVGVYRAGGTAEIATATDPSLTGATKSVAQSILSDPISGDIS